MCVCITFYNTELILFNKVIIFNLSDDKTSLLLLLNIQSVLSLHNDLKTNQHVKSSF